MRYKRRKGQLRLQSVVRVHVVAGRQALVGFGNAQMTQTIATIGQEGVNRTVQWIEVRGKDPVKAGAGGHHLARIRLFWATDFEQ